MNRKVKSMKTHVSIRVDNENYQFFNLEAKPFDAECTPAGVFIRSLGKNKDRPGLDVLVPYSNLHMIVLVPEVDAEPPKAEKKK